MWTKSCSAAAVPSTFLHFQIWPNHATFRSVPARITRHNLKRRFPAPVATDRRGALLDYLSRYIYKTAISSQRILWQSDKQVCFSYRDSKTGEVKQLALRAEEFIRRFLQHVLPKGFRRVRSYGWLSPAAKERFARISAFLGVDRAPRPAAKPKVQLDCPHCNNPMRMIGRFNRAGSACRPP